jgi:hypothetical protein
MAIITSEGIPVNCTSQELKEEVLRRLRMRFWLLGSKDEIKTAIEKAFAEVENDIRQNTRFLHEEHDPKYCPTCGQFLETKAFAQESSLSPTHANST